MLPTMSFLTGVNAIEPKTSVTSKLLHAKRGFKGGTIVYLPKRVVSDSAASRKSLVGTALSL